MFNEYEINGVVACFKVKQRNGKIHEVILDTDDLEKLILLNKLWHVQWHRTAKTYYPHVSMYLGIKNKKKIIKNIKLSTFLFESESGIILDHINNNGLDNRRKNLRIVSKSQNAKNRKSKNSNNKSGYRNVSFIQGYWKVQLQINGKNHLFSENFTDVDEAGDFAEKMRKKYYGEYSGKN